MTQSPGLGLRITLGRNVCGEPEGIVWGSGDLNPLGLNLTSHLEPSTSSPWSSEFPGIPSVGSNDKQQRKQYAMAGTSRCLLSCSDPLVFILKQRKGRGPEGLFSLCFPL